MNFRGKNVVKKLYGQTTYTVAASQTNLAITEPFMIPAYAQTNYRADFVVSSVELTEATATLNLNADITLTASVGGTGRNTNTFTIQVLAAAANPTNTILVAFGGTAAAITCTVTPNNGTNNGAVPVNLTTANLVELINTGAVTGKTVTLTDASSFRTLQTATGGDATALADGGEGDGIAGTFSGGAAGTGTIKLQTCHAIDAAGANWVDAEAITITGDGNFTQNLLDDVAGDQTYLPLRTIGRYVATTGVGQGFVVSAIYVPGPAQ